jgi:hypothetical protein
VDSISGAPREAMHPHVVRLWNHAGTGVGNGVGRTPERKACRTCLGAKEGIHCPAILLLAPVDAPLGGNWGDILSGPPTYL